MVNVETLYLIVLMNSICFAAAWLVVTLRHPGLSAARYWLAALLMTSAAGVCLVAGAETHGAIFLLGSTLVAGSFAAMWQGVRQYHSNNASVLAIAAIMGANICAVILSGDSREMINAASAAVQVIPAALALGVVVAKRARTAGDRIAMTGALMVVAGQGAEAITFAMALSGKAGSSLYATTEGWYLLAAIMGGTLWQLGYLIMAADRLKLELVSLSATDDLTGLRNRRALRQALLHFERASRCRDTKAALLMIDMDRFKSINDRHGHSAGDAALVHVSNLLKKTVRKADVCTRLGGDEFCVFLPDADESIAQGVRDRFEAALEEHPLIWRGKSIRLEASVGTTLWRATSRTRLADAIGQADMEMFREKAERRPVDSAPGPVHDYAVAG